MCSEKPCTKTTTRSGFGTNALCVNNLVPSREEIQSLGCIVLSVAQAVCFGKRGESEQKLDPRLTPVLSSQAWGTEPWAKPIHYCDPSFRIKIEKNTKIYIGKVLLTIISKF